MPAWITPLLCPVWWAPSTVSLSTTTIFASGRRRAISRAVARPTIPAPTTARSQVVEPPASVSFAAGCSDGSDSSDTAENLPAPSQEPVCAAPTTGRAAWGRLLAVARLEHGPGSADGSRRERPRFVRAEPRRERSQAFGGDR